MAGVIWVIGCCMILMAGLVKLPLKLFGALGLTVIGAHNLIPMSRLVAGLEPNRLSGLWKIFYVGFYAGPIQLGADGPSLIVLYSIIPWIGVMAAGYALGKVVTLEAAQRKKLCFAIGLSAIALFLVLRGFNVYGDPRPWHSADSAHPMPAVLSFLNTTKYPASLCFLLI